MFSSLNPQQRRPRKDYDRQRDPDSPRSKSKRDGQKPSSSARKTSNTANAPREKHRNDRASDSDSDSSTPRGSRKVRMVVPEMDRRKPSNPTAAPTAAATTPEQRPENLPYPSFSKAHSREAVGSRESFKTTDPFTPDPTDLSKGRSSTTSAPSKTAPKTFATDRTPPTAPMAEEEPGLARTKSGGSMKNAADNARKDLHAGRRSADSRDHYGEQKSFSASMSSLRQAEEGSKDPPRSSPLARPASANHMRHKSGPEPKRPSNMSGSPSPQSKPRKDTTSRKNLTTINTEAAPDRKQDRKPPTLIDNEGSSLSDNDSLRTPRGHDPIPRTPSSRGRKADSPIEILHPNDGPDTGREISAEPTPGGAPPPPPPPPPPAVDPPDPPRVDYLLQYGGLPKAIPKDFSSASDPVRPQMYHQYVASPPQPAMPKVVKVQSTFGPYHELLDKYKKVMEKKGSVAVATGYRSVARRLLDRLEQVFSRNISSEVCPCVMCQQNAPHTKSGEEADDGVSWGEVLELVSGRRELPPWPPFHLETSAADFPGLGITSIAQQAPMQKLDVDVPEEYRDHYIRQSKKTKNAVQNWLQAQPEEATSPPAEVDDGTLVFAMLTYLEPQRRGTFNALLNGLSSVPDSRALPPFNHRWRRPKSVITTSKSDWRCRDCTGFLGFHATRNAVCSC